MLEGIVILLRHTYLSSTLTYGRLQVFLLFGDFEPSGWQKTLSNSRSAYTALRGHFLHNIEHPDEVNTVDPLADDQNVRNFYIAIFSHAYI